MISRVVIVNAGGRMQLSAEAGDYDQTVDFLVRTLTGLKSVTPPERNRAEAKVVTSVEDADMELQHGRVDVLIFMTLGLRHEAERIKTQYPKVKVIVLTGLLPDDEVVLVDKSWLNVDLVRGLL